MRQCNALFVRGCLPLALMVITLVLIPHGVSAAGEADPTTLLGEIGKVIFGTPDPPNIQTVIGGLIKLALSAVGTIFFALVLYAGFLWMTAQGDAEKVTKARDILIQATIGIVIIAAAYAITYAVTTGIPAALK